ncbi:MAG: FAD-dependent oxidoreductase [Candidatus Manganitrophus sp. SA1]|nr:FAD-dependent oxidoreductase [Candidatus Manganitrophus morganii]
MTNQSKLRVVVIGNGMAGIAVVEALLKTGAPLSITLFGDEPQTHYNRILLSDLLAGKTEAERIFTRPRNWYAERGIDAKLGLAITGIDPVSKYVTNADGGAAPYDALVLAVGGVPFVPPIPGREKKGVFPFRTLEETGQIIAAARSSKRAVVIGGGLLGLEAARGLINYGVSVTVAHLGDRLMEQQLDPAGASLLKRELERMGIRVLLKTTAEAILGEDKVAGVRLTTGEDLPAGMALICTGIRPNLTLARQIGLRTNRGILVDDRMETSLPGIFAVGDVIEHREKTYGLIAPLKEQGEVLADVLTGKDQRRYGGTLCATTLKVAGIHLTSAGDFLGGRGAEELIFVDTEKAIYKKCVIRQNRLAGMILLGDNKDGPRLFNLIQKGEEIGEIKSSLLGNVSVEGGAGAASGAAALRETDLVCNCNSVTKGMILSAIREKGLKSRDEVAACTQATTGCGSCSQLVDDLLSEATKSPLKVLPAATVAEKPSAKSGPMALKTLDLEKIKQEGLGIDFDRLREEGTRALAPEDYYRLKTYGICSQKHPGYFMLRIRIPGGGVTHRQLMGLADLAEVHGRGWGHLTVRQSMELHWIRVEDSLEIFEKLEAIGLSTRSACGHTLRNVMACPNGGVASDGLFDVQPWAQRITGYFVKRSDLINPTMPNRLNVYFSGCRECAPDAIINDIGFVAVERKTEDGRRLLGFELWVGGSLGAHPMLGFQLKEFISPPDALAACQAIFAIHTKFGNRNKAKSRLKYLIEQWGREKFIETFEKVFLEKQNLPENREVPLPSLTDQERRPPLWRRIGNRLNPVSVPATPGILPQRQPGYARLTVAVPLGELRAEQLRAVGRIARRHGNGIIHFTKDQNLALHWVPVRKIGRAVQALKAAGLSLKGKESGPALLACPGTEFCALAVTNAQGAARDLLRFHPEDPERAALFQSISIHLSGCPNSCAKHQVADIGLAGTMTPIGELRRFSYQLFLGGQVEGGVRLGAMVRKGITEEMVVPTVDALLGIVATHRLAGESFQETVLRLGADQVASLLEKEIGPLAPEWFDAITMIPDLIEVR